MSTRANIIIKDKHEHIFVYRHSDGYPEGVAPTLLKFKQWLIEDKIRNNVSQSAGWLFVLGALEYQSYTNLAAMVGIEDENKIPAPEDWKVGAYEPTTGLHGDIDCLYLIDLNEKEIYQLIIERDEEHDIKENWHEFEKQPLATEIKEG